MRVRPPGYCLAAELNHALTVRRAWLWPEPIKDQVPADVSREVQTSKSDLTARGVAFDLLQLAKRIGPQCKAAEYEDLSGEKSLTLDRIIFVDDRMSHRAYR